ncbi:MAG TPA: hypothetical protein VGH20_10430 [Myxococcales bacterium]
MFAGGGSTDAKRPATARATHAGDDAEIVREDKGHIEALRKARIQALSAVEVQPLFDAGARARLDEASMVKFTVPGRSAGKDLGVMTAVLLHGSDEPVPLAVVDKGNGQVEVPFTPHDFGRFDVQLRANGVPIAQGRVGVVGSAAGAQYADDYLDYTADLRTGRNRPQARGSRRR